ncbi:putative ABC transporter permease [Clostridium grantii]|uniref:Uncharacterized membrane protein n=1 Tax=Clostridium grantii DSM 8605 TaxID=1121316 RepID=A0A1M5QJ48_9CLOT|nr:putative ABC transporter permease [Clostridium grantii]SHH14157.1 Uncharacterized membrane protein [Clostridium grantii DSM 8605]
MSIYSLLFQFLIYGYVGWIWESSYVSFKQKKVINRGFLHGPIIPIYACSIITILLSVESIQSLLPTINWIRIITCIIYIGFVCTLWEYTVSYLLEMIFSTRWWDYSGRRYNLNGRVALGISFGWSIGGFLIWYFINPLVEKLIKIIPYEIGSTVLGIVYGALIIDILLTVKELISLRKAMVKLHMISKELSGKVVYSIESLSGEIEIRKEQIKETLEQKRGEFSEAFEGRKEAFKDSVGSNKEKVIEQIIYLKGKSGVKLTETQNVLLRRFNGELERTVHYSRFFKVYPKAESKKFENLIEVLRVKRRKEL